MVRQAKFDTTSEMNWFETCAMLVAKATNQVMSIVRYADDFVILARRLADGFVQKLGLIALTRRRYR